MKDKELRETLEKAGIIKTYHPEAPEDEEWIDSGLYANVDDMNKKINAILDYLDLRYEAEYTKTISARITKRGDE